MISWDQKRPEGDDERLGPTYHVSATPGPEGVGFYSQRGAQSVFVPWWVIEALQAQRAAGGAPNPERQGA